jgi:hypothetical protein
MPTNPLATTTYADTAAADALTSAQGYADSVLAGQTGANTSALLRRNPIPRVPFTPLPGGVGTFDSGHGWTVTGPVTEAVDDTAVYRSGSQSLRVRSTTASGLIQITKSGLTAIDMSTRHGQGVVRVSDMTQMSSIELRMGSTGASAFTNSTRWPSWLNATNTRPALNNDWTTLAWTGDGETLTGTIVMTAVINWELRIQLASTATDVTVWVDQVGTRPQPLSSILPNGFVVWTMDDSFDDQISIGGRELDRFGMPAVMYHIISEVVGATAGHCTVAQVKDRLALGWEHGYHALDQTEHVNRATSLTAAELDANFRQGISVLRSWGFGVGGVLLSGRGLQRDDDPGGPAVREHAADDVERAEAGGVAVRQRAADHVFGGRRDLLDGCDEREAAGRCGEGP